MKDNILFFNKRNGNTSLQDNTESFQIPPWKINSDKLNVIVFSFAFALKVFQKAQAREKAKVQFETQVLLKSCPWHDDFERG